MKEGGMVASVAIAPCIPKVFIVFVVQITVHAK